MLETKARSEEAANTAAALAAADRKAKQYKRDDSNMLDGYDSWVQGLLAKKGASTSPRPGSPAAGHAASPPAGLRSPAAASNSTSPRFAAGSLSRSASQPASPGQPAAGSAAADLDKYDRIAALLESRGVGADSLSRSASARSLPFGATAGGDRRNVGAAGVVSATSPSATLSNRPSFRL